MKFNNGQKVIIKMFLDRPVHWNPKGEMDKWMGEEVTISYFLDNDRYFVKENVWCWQDSDFVKCYTDVDLLDDALFEI